MFHRIAPLDPSRLDANEVLKVSPQTLETFIIKAKKRGYTFISPDEILTVSSKDKKILCITLDDGYKDNLDFALPIFLEYKIPFCIYVCTSFPENQHNMWWYALEDFLLSCSKFYIDNNQISNNTKSEKEQNFYLLKSYMTKNKSNNYISKDNQIHFTINDKNLFSYNPRSYDDLALSWDDIRILMQTSKGLCTIGNHTHSHLVFNATPKRYIIDDIQKAQQLLQTHLDFLPKHFCYPFGSIFEVDETFSQIPQILNFLTAATTRIGDFTKAKNKMFLPRIFATEKMLSSFL